MLISNSIRHYCFPNHQFHKSVQKKTRRNHRVMQLNSVWLKYHKIGNEAIQINITQAEVLELSICLTQINCTKYWFAYWTHSKHMFFFAVVAIWFALRCWAKMPCILGTHVSMMFSLPCVYEIRLHSYYLPIVTLHIHAHLHTEFVIVVCV